MSWPRGPRPGSVVSKLREFFAGNPDEELTYTDIMSKFSCSAPAASDAVRQLREAALVESVHVIRLRSKGIGR